MRIIILLMLFMLPELCFSQQELPSNNILDTTMERFEIAASTWGPAIESAASRLFWSLATISMVWTFGFMALRQADIGEFFAEFIRFTIFTGCSQMLRVAKVLRIVS